MNGVKGWVVTLIFYFVILAVLIANLDDRPSILGFLPKRTHSLPRPGHAPLSSLGITGSKLLGFFQEHLLEFEDIYSPRDDQLGISLYYDSFKRYLYETPSKSPKTVECDPEKSIVAKLTRDVEPIGVHSHNDYWRDLPLFQGIAYGAISTEADIWIYPKHTGPETPEEERVLAVGHNEAFLDPKHRTLDNLYTEPLKYMLDQVNCREGYKAGVFYDSPEDTLFLYLDFKDHETQPVYKLLMDKYLKPLVEEGYLTYFDLQSKKLVWNQISVILTGDFPKELSVIDNGEHGYFNDDKRYVFQEANMLEPTALGANASLVSTACIKDLLEHCGSDPRVVISQSKLSGSTMECVKSLVGQSHEAGLKTRIWGIPNWPIELASNLWHQQRADLGVDLLNVDNLDLVRHLV